MKNSINICIVHFNTPLLTECLIKSINKFTPNSKIYIFDNSNKLPFTYRQDNIVYFDNTQGQIINFDEWLKNYPNRFKSTEGTKEFGSAKHCYTIQKCIELINDNFILLDSDILLKKDISELADNSYVYIGEKEKDWGKIYRVAPYLCFINVQLLKKYNITYFNDKYMHGLYISTESEYYDTGAWFLKECENLPSKNIKLEEYIVHYKAGSWINTYSKRAKRTIVSEYNWLNSYKEFYVSDYKEKIVVTMTSWKSRIKNVKQVLSTVLKNTITPDKIIINLSVEEFPNKEKELPEELIQFINENNIISINWIDGRNTKQWKKIIPTLKMFPNDCVICVDDDRLYPKNFIQSLYETHLKYPNSPITVNHRADVCGMLQHAGHGTLDKLEFYGNILDVVDDEIMSNPSSDTFFTYMCNKTGRKIMPDDNYVDKHISMYNEVNPLHKSEKTYDRGVQIKMLNLLNKKFNIDLINMINSKKTAITLKNRKRIQSTNQKITVERPRVKIESPWTPIQTTPVHIPAQNLTPKAAPPKNKKDKTIHIKRLFY